MPSTWHETYYLSIKYSVAVAHVNVVKYNPVYGVVIKMYTVQTENNHGAGQTAQADQPICCSHTAK